MLPLLSPGHGDDSRRSGNAGAFGTSPRTPLPPPEAQHLTPKTSGRSLAVSPGVSVNNEGSTTVVPPASPAVDGSTIESSGGRSGNNAARREDLPPRTLPLQLRHSAADQHSVTQGSIRADGNGRVSDTPRNAKVRSRLLTDDDDATASAETDADAGVGTSANASVHQAAGAHGVIPAAKHAHGNRSGRALSFDSRDVKTPRTLSLSPSSSASPSASPSTSTSTSTSPDASASPSLPTTAGANSSSTIFDGADATLYAHEHRAEVFADW